MNRVSTATRLTAKKTHEIFNVSHSLKNYNLFKSDPAMIRGLESFGKGLLDGHKIENYSMLSDFGDKCGSEEMIETAVLAETNRPTLKQFDTFGQRIDVAEFHPAYHSLMKQAKEDGVASYGYNNELTSKNAHLTRGALLYMQNQVEPGICCPIVMTNAAIPVLRRVPGMETIVEKLCHQSYDARDVPIEQKTGITAGMSMTEKQGGSDVRSNTTMATPIHPNRTGQGEEYVLTGHKWFTSAPMCDVFLTLSKTDSNQKSPSCFLVPRWLPNGDRNEGFRVMRLKNKLADRSNASSEVEYDNAYAVMIGEEGRGVKTIIEMVQSTRLDCALGSAGMGRRALHETLHYTANRSAFGSNLQNLPLMQNLLADLCVEAEANTLMAMKMSHLFNHSNILDSQEESKAVMEDENMSADDARNLFRIGVAISKYFITKRMPYFVYECMEAHGGNGFVEDLPMARLYRHAPLNSIWEGSGNVMALDVLRAAEHIPLFMHEVKLCVGIDPNVDIYIARLERYLNHVLSDGVLSLQAQANARGLVEQMAIAFQASLMLRYGCPQATEMFIASRIGCNLGTSNSAELPNRGVHYGSTAFTPSSAKYVIEENMPIFSK